MNYLKFDTQAMIRPQTAEDVSLLLAEAQSELTIINNHLVNLLLPRPEK